MIGLSDENNFAREGTLDFIDNALDRSSGTIHARATVPNPDLFLAPGQFARLRVAIAPPAPVYLLPDAAVVLDQSQHLVMTVAPDATVKPKIVTTGDLRGGLRVIQSGLEPTDRVIIDGLVRAMPGTKVTPQDGTIHYDATADGQRLGERARRPHGQAGASHDPQLHRPADLRHRPQRLRDADRARRARHPARLRNIRRSCRPRSRSPRTYPGASAEVVSRTVATPLEQEINGVENMLYISSQSTGDGKLTITVTFRIGTDLNVAQMLTQNRVQDALPRLPEDVQRLGVQVRKATPNILLAVHLYSPDSSRDTLYISNYATLHVKDVLARLPGVGDVQIIGGREYAMRIWLDPDKVAAHNLNANEVLAALRAQNVQVSAGILNQPPVASKQAYQLNVQTLGRLSTPEEFAAIVLKSDSQGRVTRLRDVGRVEIGASDYGSTAFMDRRPGLPLLIFAQPGANSLAVEHEVLDAMKTLGKDFPPGLAYKVIYDPTDLCRQIGRRGGQDDLRRDPAGGRRRVPVPAELARRDHSGDRDPGLAGRYLHLPLCRSAFR